MGTLNIAITGAQRLPLRVTADGAPLGMTRNRHGNLTYSLQTQAQRVKLCIETVHELRSPLWFFASLFFFLISVFGIFDVRRPYDRKGRTLRAVFLVDMGGAPEKACALPHCPSGRARSHSAQTAPASRRRRTWPPRMRSCGAGQGR